VRRGKRTRAHAVRTCSGGPGWRRLRRATLSRGVPQGVIEEPSGVCRVSGEGGGGGLSGRAGGVCVGGVSIQDSFFFNTLWSMVRGERGVMPMMHAQRS